MLPSGWKASAFGRKTYGVADEPDTLGDTPETATAAYAELATQLVASADSVRERLRFGSIAAAAASATVLERAEEGAILVTQQDGLEIGRFTVRRVNGGWGISELSVQVPELLCVRGEVAEG